MTRASLECRLSLGMISRSLKSNEKQLIDLSVLPDNLEYFFGDKSEST